MLTPSQVVIHNRFLLAGASLLLSVLALAMLFDIPPGLFLSRASYCKVILLTLGFELIQTRLLVHSDNTAIPSQLATSKTGWVKMMIEDTVRYQPHALEAAQEFEQLFPAGGHLVYLGNRQQPFTVAMFHQLRCLEVVRQEYTEHNGRGERSLLVHHCLNYLRQSILCLADNRLEPVRSPQGPRIVSFSSDYICKDWSAIYDAAEENHREYLGVRSKL